METSAPEAEDAVADPIARWPAEVDRAILDVIASVTAAMAPTGDAALDLTRAIIDANEGGKRVRSSILLSSHGACGGGAEHAAVTLGAALELFHTAALLHDDVLDDSDTRRGRPSVHRAFATLHGERALAGDPHAFGRAGAILAGDVALLACGRTLGAGARLLPAPVGEAVAALFHNAVDLVTAGQYLDMRVAAEPIDTLPTQESDIRSVMRAKTASYTWEAPLAIGAVAAGADAGTISQLRACGLLVGVAFQLRDDILGLTGATAITGKPVGDDIREGKRTLLMWHAFTGANAGQRDTLREALGRRDASEELVEAAVAVVREVGAFDAVEEEIAHSAAVVRGRLAGLRLAEPYRRHLDALVAAAAERDR